MRKILFHLSSFEQGGAERVVSNLANQLVKQQYEIIAATQCPIPSPGPLAYQIF